jgi:HAD superfamily hydrolase (TIGR01490 family)
MAVSLDPVDERARPASGDAESMTAQPTRHRPAAFFDLDGTLIPGSANIPLARAAFAAGFVGKRELARDLRNGISFLLKGASDERSAQVRDRILRAVAGHPASDVEALADVFMADLVASIQPRMRAVLDQHAAAGHDRVVLSASPTEIVSRLAAEAGLEHGSGTTSERDTEGVYTGRLSGPFCYGIGKAEVLGAVAAERGYDLAASYAYSDSVSDEPMLRAVGHPVAVNPEPELREIALREGWLVLETGALPRVSLTSPRDVARLAGRALGTLGSAARLPRLGISSR